MRALDFFDPVLQTANPSGWSQVSWQGFGVAKQWRRWRWNMSMWHASEHYERESIKWKVRTAIKRRGLWNNWNKSCIVQPLANIDCNNWMLCPVCYGIIANKWTLIVNYSLFISHTVGWLQALYRVINYDRQRMDTLPLFSVNRILTLRLLMSYIYIYIYIYGSPILDVSRSHTTTQHSR